MIKKAEEFAVLKEHLKKLISQNDKLKRENEALKKVIEALTPKDDK